MSTARVFTNPKDSYKQGDGVTVNSSGKLYFREPGVGSTTLKAVYSDKALTIPLINPVILDSGGRAPDIFLNGDYNIQHTTSADVQIWRVNNYQPPVVDGQFDAWDASLTFAVNDYVRYTDNLYYVSLASGNVGNVPSTSPTYWSQVFFLTVYNATDTYASGAIVFYSGSLWESRSGSTGITPGTDETYWVLSGTPGAKSGYINSSFEFYLRTSPASFDIATNVTIATYETIGPTGSGATHEYAGYTPAQVDNAKFAIFDLSSSCNKSTGTDERFNLFCQFRKVGDTAVRLGPSSGGYGGATHGQDNGYADGQIVVPIDSSGIFEVYWSTLGTPNFTGLTIRYIGVKS